MTATSYRFVSIGITVQGGTNKKIKKKKKIKIKKETRGRGGVCRRERAGGSYGAGHTCIGAQRANGQDATA